MAMPPGLMGLTWQQLMQQQGGRPNLVNLGQPTGQPGEFNPVKALQSSGYGSQVKRRLGLKTGTFGGK